MRCKMQIERPTDRSMQCNATPMPTSNRLTMHCIVLENRHVMCKSVILRNGRMHEWYVLCYVQSTSLTRSKNNSFAISIVPAKRKRSNTS